MGIWRYKKGIIYFIYSPFNKKVKIGITSNSIKIRFEQISFNSPVKLKILRTIEGTLSEERDLHHKFKKYHSHNEWFKFEGELKNFIIGIKK